jgi:hypothetical protein
MAEGPVRESRPSKPAALAPAVANVRQTLEALRLGVVPGSHVLDYTVDRKGELASVRKLLAERRGLRIVWGDYGTGKTHLLDVVESLALEAGLLTARIVLNPRDLPPSHPQRLYRELLAALRYPDDAARGWEPLFRKLETSADHRDPGGGSFSRFFSPLLFARHHGHNEVSGWLSDYVDGYRIDGSELTRTLRGIGWQGPRLLSLSDFRTYGRMYVHLIGTLATWARDAGYAGLVLLVDEVEYVDSLSAQQRELAAEVLKHYAAAVLSPSKLQFDPDDLYKGGHPVHRSIPLRCRDDQPLSVVMSLTPLDEIVRLVDAMVAEPECHLQLQAIRRRDCRELVDKVSQLYVRGYPDIVLGPEQLERLRLSFDEAFSRGKDTPRDLVEILVYLLDAIRYGRALGSIG